MTLSENIYLIHMCQTDITNIIAQCKFGISLVVKVEVLEL